MASWREPFTYCGGKFASNYYRAFDVDALDGVHHGYKVVADFFGSYNHCRGISRDDYWVTVGYGIVHMIQGVADLVVDGYGVGPVPYGTTFYNDICPISASLVYFACSKGKYDMGGLGPLWQWDGETFHSVDCGFPNTYEHGHRILAFGASDIWVAGGGSGPNYGKIVHWDGNSWSVEHQTTDQFYSDGAWASGAADIYVAARATGPTSVLWHYNGLSWSAVSSCPVDAAWGVITAIWGTGPDDVFVGVASGAATGSKICHWDGNSWTVHNTPGDGQSYVTVAQIFGWAAGHIWAVAGFSSGSPKFWKFDGVDTWENVLIEPADDANWQYDLHGSGISPGIWDACVIYDDKPAAEAALPNEGPYWLINDDGDNEVDEFGRLVRDKTVASRARFRLLCRRGQWRYDRTIGSRFHEIKLLRGAQGKCERYALEALKPLIDEGSVLDVTVGQVLTDRIRGFLAVPITITTPEGEVSLGWFRLGEVR